MVEIKKINSPYLKAGFSKNWIMFIVFGLITFISLVYSIRYDSSFIIKYLMYVLFGNILEVIFIFLSEGKFGFPRSSNSVTVSLLVVSIPSNFPHGTMLAGITVAVLFGKLLSDKSKIRLNPMLLGRLFLMIIAAESIQNWVLTGTEIETITSATPLGLYSFEKIVYSPFNLLIGNISYNWQGIYTLIPSSPGEVIPLLSIICGIIMYYFKIIDWRTPVFFVIGFALFSYFLNVPVFFSLVSGSVLFSAVFIITDYKTTPASKTGRIIAGLLAGVINAIIRNQGYYPEGIVIAILLVNLVSPLIDMIVFYLRAKYLEKK